MRIMIINFPDYWHAPTRLLALDGNCGPITLWGILKYFGKGPRSDKIIKSCCYTKKHGTFPIALAVALREYGFSVDFYTEHDTHPKAIEIKCYAKAKLIGVNLKGKITLDKLISQINRKTIPVVFYNTDENNGHFSPLIRFKNNNLILPYSQEGFIPKQKFLKQWSKPDILRQCLVVSKK